MSAKAFLRDRLRQRRARVVARDEVLGDKRIDSSVRFSPCAPRQALLGVSSLDLGPCASRHGALFCFEKPQ